MPGLTVTEKEHWKDRLAKRIERKIEVLKASDPGLFTRLNREARMQTLQSLGLAELSQRLETVEKQEEECQKQKVRIEREMVAVVRGVAVEDLDDGSYYGRYSNDVDQAIDRRKFVIEDELLAQCDLGRQILKLRAERDSLLDAIWLATSPRQVKDLWSKVAELLGDEPTQLERDALAIPPVADE
jgi:hypothetical protein